MPEEAVAASGGSEAVQSGQESVSTEATTSEATTSAEASTTTDPFDDAKVETFERKYVEKLRGESAKYRTQAKELSAKFEGIDEGILDGLLGVAKAYETDPDAAREVLQTLMEGLTPAEQEALKEELSTEEEKKTLTAEEVEQMLADREAAKEAEKAEAAQLEGLKKSITELGYDLDEANPNPDTALLFFFAGQQTGDGAKDFTKAHAEVQALKQKVISDYKESVKEKNSRYGRVQTGATPSGQDGGAKKLGLSNGKSREALSAWLDATIDQ